MPKKPRSYYDARNQQLVASHIGGNSLDSIASEFGISRRRVTAILRDMGHGLRGGSSCRHSASILADFGLDRDTVVLLVRRHAAEPRNEVST